MLRTACGEMVLMSTISLPAGGFSSRPSAPSTTASTCGVSGSMVMTISAPRAASAGEAAAVAPWPTASARAAGTMSQARTA